MDVELKLLPHQRQLLASHSARSLLLCGRGAGKSFVLSAMTLLYLLQGKNVMVGGQRYDTLHDTLYAEIKRMATDWNIYDRIEWREAPMQMRFAGHFVYFGTYESVDASRGYTNITLMLLDEMFLAPPDILSVWGPCMRGAEVTSPRIVGATTPRMDSPWNILMANPDCGWEIIRARTADNVFITTEQLSLIRSGIRTDEMMRQELDGEIVLGSNASALIKVAEFPERPGMSMDSSVICGLDCAEGVERDCTAFFARQGNHVIEMWKLDGIDHERTVHRIREFNAVHKISKLNMDMAFSDYEFNILKYEMPCEQVQFARAASDKDKYANVRAEMFFNLCSQVRKGLCVDGFALSAELKRQMCAISWRKNSQGRLLVTPKDELRAVLNMSTDIADAAALSCLELSAIDDPAMALESVQDITAAELAEIMEDE